MAPADETDDPIVRIEGLSKSFGSVRAVDNLWLSIGAGEFFALLGPSGCGKTSLLRLLAGFETPDAGRIVIAGVDMTDVPPHRRPVNMMFQSYALFPHMTVAQNIAFGLNQQGLPKSEIALRVTEMLRLVQLDGLDRRRPDQLSGGQKQRVALARALARRPAILLLDEPLAALDKNLREETQTELVALQDRLKTTFIVVTHDQGEAMVLSQRLAVMRDGRFEQVGTPAEIYEQPANRTVAEFIGEINLIDGEVIASENGVQTIATEAGAARVAGQNFPTGAKVTLALRPERLRLEKPKGDAAINQFLGTVKGSSYRGDSTLFEVGLACGLTLRVLRQNSGSGADAIPVGANVALCFSEDAGILLKT
ncbi:MAG: ABC transporter ATP-binding protein [Methylovirgula sp.]|jgi:putrescine transport system ATP-binding protein